MRFSLNNQQRHDHVLSLALFHLCHLTYPNEIIKGIITRKWKAKILILIVVASKIDAVFQIWGHLYCGVCCGQLDEGR